MVDLSVSIVNWNGGETIAKCLRSLADATHDMEVEMIVVDNASTDESVEFLHKEFPDLRLIQNDENKGYAFGNNQAFRTSRGRYFLILNNDVMVKGDALEEMVRYMDGHPDVGLLGGRLQNPSGTFQPSANRRFPNLLDVFLEEIFFLSSLKYVFLKTSLGAKCSTLFWNFKEAQPVAWVGGACMLVRRHSFEEVCLLDDHFFFYREDCDLCLRMKKRGWKVVYHPRCLFVHHWGHSSRKNQRKISMESRRSLLYYFQKHHGRFGFWTAKSFLLAGLLLRVFLLFLKSLFKTGERERLLLFKEMISIFAKMRNPSDALPIR